MTKDQSMQGRPTLEDAPDVLTPEETAKVLRIGRNQAYALIRAGKIPSLRMGRKLIVPKVALKRMLDCGSANG